MAEKILSPGVFTNEIDQSFLPATLGPIGAAIVGPTVKGPILNPTVVSSYSEYVNIFGEVIESGSDSYQYLTSHTAKEYLKQGGPCTIVRVGSVDPTKATAVINSGSMGIGGVRTGTDIELFTLEALGNGPQYNSVSGSAGYGSDNLILPASSSAGNSHFDTGTFGGRSNNFRWEISQRNTAKGTFTLLIRQGDDTTTKKQILETHENLSLDPYEPNYISKRIGDASTTVDTEGGVSFVKPTGTYPNKSSLVRVKNVPEAAKTPTYIDTNGNVNKPYSGASTNGVGWRGLPEVGSGSKAGGFEGGDYGANDQQSHPFGFYENIASDNAQGVALSVSNVLPTGTTDGGGYGTALSILSNKDEYDFNVLYLPGIIDRLHANHNVTINQAIQLCEDRGDCFLVYDNTSKTDTVATAKTNTEARNSSYAATYYPWVQIQDATAGVFRFVPPSVVMAGVYHFNDTIGQPWFAPAGLNRGGIDSAVQAYRKLTQTNRDDLYDSNCNPIATFPGQGVTAFGQKTTQKKASALDRVNVRRLLINIKKFVASSSRNLVFEQNTSDLRDQFLNVVNPYLEQVQANSGLNAFRVVMDDSNNTPETIDRNKLIGQVFLQPTRTAEFIVLDFTVQPTGASFPE